MNLHWTNIGIELAVPRVPSSIPATELAERRASVRTGMAEQELDALVVVGNESEFSSLRYLSDYWPLFESGGIVFAPTGDPLLISGPESETFAQTRSQVDQVRLLKSFRESADPSYPEVSLNTFDSVFAELGVSRPSRIGISGSFAANMVIIEDLQRSFPEAELLRADEVVTDLRIQKSDWEIENLRAAFSISEIALDAVLERMTPGMTELQVVGIAQAAMYANGAEYEGMAQYVLSGPNSRSAISRPSQRVIEKNEIVQLNISARVNGYSSGVGRPIVIGNPTPEHRSLIEFCRDAHYATQEWIGVGVEASSIATRYSFLKAGRESSFLYGPCTGLGLMETERPWIESNSTFTIKPGMTFQMDTFAQGADAGVRWENGIVIGDEGVELLSSIHMDKYTI
jgi:Xaa-Pro aminopeptidase